MPNMKRFTGLLNRTKSQQDDIQTASTDSPEANAARAVRLFCESGSASNRDEEVLHLPVIVESAESSPSAAAASAQQIRKFLTKEYAVKPHVQYNAIMLIRILCDNPGATFTKCFDKAFVATIKECLRNCRDSSTQQILRETLDHLEAERGYDAGLEGLMAMWRKEKGPQAAFSQRPQVYARAQQNQGPPYGFDAPQRSSHGGSQHTSRQRQLPPPQELASRVEEARNTAKILLQLLQSTPQQELVGNELIQEFGERCQSAQRSMQQYIACDSPAPDDDTMLTLIETNEQLSLATSRCQRAMLAARRAMGISSGPLTPGSETMSGANGYVPPPPAQPENVAFAQAQPPQTGRPAFGSGYFGNQQPRPTQATQPPATTTYEGYQAPPGPPPSMLNRLNSREAPARTSPPAEQQISNPFEDPVEHQQNSAPLAIETARQPPGRFGADTTAASSTYSTQSELQRRDTMALENAYTTNQTEVQSPAISSPSTTSYRQSGAFSAVSPASPQTPKAGALRGSGYVPSYMKRPVSAANGLTMRGAQEERQVNEIDSHSQVGRSDGHVSPATSRSLASRTEDDDGMYDVSPTESRRADFAAAGAYRQPGR